jgi:CelD/BcsL family acetyltransferase involved in cellulose biosynthesis
MQQHSSWVGRFGVFEPVGGVMSDYFGVVARDDFVFSPDEIFQATRGRFSACLFSHLDETQIAHGLNGVQPRIGLRTRIGNSADVYWDELRRRDKKLVYDTDRREKKLVKEHGQINFEWQSSNREDHLSKLIEMKKNQYTRTGKFKAPLFTEGNVALLNALRDETSESCEGVLSILRANDEIIAMHFGLRCYDTLHVWFPVYSQKFAPYSPGRILLKYLITESIASGIKCLDRGEGDTQAKRDFSNEEHLYYRGFWRDRSLSGKIAGIAAAIHWRL